MIRHVVLFKFRPDVPDSEREAFISALRELPHRIAEIQTFEVGEDITRAPRSYHLALVSTFPDEEALRRYAEHPEHVVVAERGRALCESIVAVDYRVGT